MLHAIFTLQSISTQSYMNVQLGFMQIPLAQSMAYMVYSVCKKEVWSCSIMNCFSIDVSSIVIGWTVGIGMGSISLKRAEVSFGVVSLVSRKIG